MDAQRPRQVLVIADSADDRACTIQALIALGARADDVLEAGDGVEALERIEHSGSVDLVLTQVGMPRMNGLDLLQRLREQARSVEAWLLTRKGTEPYLPQALELGARGGISLDADNHALRTRLASLLSS